MPRFYLERFADAGDRVQQVWLPGDRQHPVSISNASVIRDFYNINIGTKAEPTLSDFWEKRFSEVEGTAAKAFEAVVDDRIWPPRDEDRDAIALWAALQHLRSPAIRNQQQDHVAAIIRVQTAVAGIAYLKKVMTEGLQREVGEAELECEWEDLTKPGGPKIELGASAHIRILRDLIEPTAQMFAGCGWSLYRFRRRALLTSDTPVTLLAHPDAHPMMGVGLGTAGAFLVPLSRRVGLYMGQPEMPDTHLQGTTVIARYFNSLTANNARRSVFHHPADNPLLDVVLHEPVVNEVDDGGVDEWVSREGWGAAFNGRGGESTATEPPAETLADYEVTPIADTRRADFKNPRRQSSERALDHYEWPIPHRVFKNPHIPA